MRIGLQLTGNPAKQHKLQGVIRKYVSEYRNEDFIWIADESVLKREIPTLDVLVCYRVSREIFQLASSGLRWIHFGAAGIEHSLFPELLRSDVLITNARGIHKGPVSEYIIGAMLYFSKRFSDCENFKKDREWKQWEIAARMVQLRGKTLGIIGYGAIGKELARKARAFDMEIVALKNRGVKQLKTLNPVILTGQEGLSRLLKLSDFIAVTCPLTPSTRGMLGRKELQLIKPSAVLINISRGAVVDESALIDALQGKHLAGAALDVFTREPLPADSPFFDLPNVLLSPHISGNFPEYQEEVARQFAQNLSRFQAGKRLLNIVDKKRQY
ncbi:MAG: D-2-hydroxyacid dehydrogenase [FCB group bacterium]|nr:D-2-hydroxyacid dehydrogenase [FCB group bacterium]